jgi:hypothetical protein
MARFGPAVRRSRLRESTTAFLSGYFGEKASGGVDPIGAAALLYLFTLRYWYGIGTDRSLATVYCRRLAWRYVRGLRRQMFVRGTPDILGGCLGR